MLRQTRTTTEALLARLDETCGIRPNLIQANNTPLSPQLTRSHNGRLPRLPNNTNHIDLDAATAARRRKSTLNEDYEDDEPDFDPYSRADVSWSDEISTLRKIKLQLLSKHKRTVTDIESASLISYQPFSRIFLLSFFKTLRLNDLKIEHVDLDTLQHLKEVVLIGNEIKFLHARNLPTSLESLSLSANRLTRVPDLSTLQNLITLSLAYNHIDTLTNELHHSNKSQPTSVIGTGRPPSNDDASTRPRTAASTRESATRPTTATTGEIIPPAIATVLPSNLVSLDICFCDISDLNETLRHLVQTKNLRLLNMMGNPFSLLERYRRTTLLNLPQLFALDDLEITEAERSSVSSPTTPTTSPIQDSQNQIIDSEVVMRFTLAGMTGLASPHPIEPREAMEADEPPDEYIFLIELRLGQHPTAIVLAECRWQPEVIDFAASPEIKCVADVALRDSFMDGLHITLTRKRLTSKLRDVEPAETMPPSREASRPPSGKSGEAAAAKKAATTATASGKPSPSRPVSGAGKKPAAAAAAPSKPLESKSQQPAKPVTKEEGRWLRVVVETLVIGKANVQLRDVFEGQTAISGDYHLESKTTLPAPPPAATESSNEPVADAPNDVSNLVATVRVGVKLHPPPPEAVPEVAEVKAVKKGKK
ncbi:hypothetical protein SmJEL517_g01821 [Synchytrium microbalum]|uniref:Uncharacterized protein n=1 Tax=Synchytrium microbalum TaxID=1806994 RepID=A0A507C310_9FUNG|nr:uncharacterized protein SmJEL517_g01821 [Synchytrium microbalum]TPX35900.1 hypothetical protein SmJEL517_g01821 [Synchytrium microbalum]